MIYMVIVLNGRDIYDAGFLLLSYQIYVEPLNLSGLVKKCLSSYLWNIMFLFNANSLYILITSSVCYRLSKDTKALSRGMWDSLSMGNSTINWSATFS